MVSVPCGVQRESGYGVGVYITNILAGILRGVEPVGERAAVCVVAPCEFTNAGPECGGRRLSIRAGRTAIGHFADNEASIYVSFEHACSVVCLLACVH